MQSPKFVLNETEVLLIDQDALGWVQHAQRLALLLALPERPTPLTIGIQGDWGSGKTSFINLVLAQLGEQQPKLEMLQNDHKKSLVDHIDIFHYPVAEKAGGYENYPPIRAHVLRFDSWVFSQTDFPVDYLFPLYITQVLRDYLVATGIHKEDHRLTDISLMSRILRVGEIGGSLAAAGSTVAGHLGVYGPIFAAGATALGAGLKHVLEHGGDTTVETTTLNSELVEFKPRFQQMVELLLQLSDEQIDALNQIPDNRFISSDLDATTQQITNPVDRLYNRLFVIVDDLDRLSPLTAVDITEKIKLFMDVPGCVFILAADLQIIRDGLKAKLGEAVSEEEGRNYLDKIVKIQYHVPQVSQHKAREFAQYYSRWASTFIDKNIKYTADCLLCVFSSIASNPRTLKRILNNFSFTLDLLYGPDQPADPDNALRIAALTILYQYDEDAARNFYTLLAQEAQPNRLLKDSVDTEQLRRVLQGGRQIGNDARSLADFSAQVITLDYSVEAWLSAFTASTLSSFNVVV